MRKDAQQQQDDLAGENLERIKQMSDEDVERAKKLINEASSGGSGQTSSSARSSLPRDLVEDVMQTHGVSRERAEELIEKFGG